MRHSQFEVAALGAVAVGVPLLVWARVPEPPQLSTRLAHLALLLAWSATGWVLASVADMVGPGFLVQLGTLIASGSLVAGSYGATGASYLAASLVPAVGLHLALILPDGRLGAYRRHLATAFYALAGATSLVLLTVATPAVRQLVVPAEALAAAVLGWSALASRHRRAASSGRRRLETLAAGAVAALALGVAVTMTGIAEGAEPKQLVVALEVVSLLIPLSLVVGAFAPTKVLTKQLLLGAMAVAGLTLVVIAAHLVLLAWNGLTLRGKQVGLTWSMLVAALAATAFPMVWRRLSDTVNTALEGRRTPPEDVVKIVSSRLSRALPLEEALLGVAESLKVTMSLAKAELWTGSQGLLERTVSVPRQRAARLALSEQERVVLATAGVTGRAWTEVWLPNLAADRPRAHLRVVPLNDAQEVLGLLVVERRTGDDPFDPEDDAVLLELARQLGLALHNVQLDLALRASVDEVHRQAEELRASRTRIVTVADAERRRIERDLHDGAQQQLLAVAIHLQLAREALVNDREGLKPLLDSMASEISETLAQLRDLAHGIYPALLTDCGLVPALQAAASKHPLRVTVESTSVQRYATEVESAVYFCCLEALQNAAKHAGSEAKVRLRLWEEAGALFFEVADDGCGFEVASTNRGQGFLNMRDRIGAVGGRVWVEASPGRGTRVNGALPIQPSGRQGPLKPLYSPQSRSAR